MIALANISACFSGDDGLSYSLRIREPRYFDLGTLFGRVERFEARRKRYAPSAVMVPPRALDAALLEHGGAFERAWAKEIATLIALKRNDTPEARFAARRARATTARLAQRIEFGPRGQPRRTEGQGARHPVAAQRRAARADRPRRPAHPSGRVEIGPRKFQFDVCECGVCTDVVV